MAATSSAFSPRAERAAVHVAIPSSRSRQVASMPIAPAPSTSARRGAHGWRPPIARAWRRPRAQIEAGSASTPSRPSARGTGMRLAGALGHQLAREAVQRA